MELKFDSRACPLNNAQCHIHVLSQGFTWILYNGKNEISAFIKEALSNMSNDNTHLSKITIPAYEMAACSCLKMECKTQISSDYKELKITFILL